MSGQTRDRAAVVVGVVVGVLWLSAFGLGIGAVWARGPVLAENLGVTAALVFFLGLAIFLVTGVLATLPEDEE